MYQSINTADSSLFEEPVSRKHACRKMLPGTRYAYRRTLHLPYCMQPWSGARNGKRAQNTAIKAGLFTGHGPARGSGEAALKKTRGSSWFGLGGVQNLTGRVGSGRFGSGQIRRFSSITGRAGSPQPDPTREK